MQGVEPGVLGGVVEEGAAARRVAPFVEVCCVRLQQFSPYYEIIRC